MENPPQNPGSTPQGRQRRYRQPDSWKSIFGIAIFALVLTAIFDRPPSVQGAQEGSSFGGTFSDVAIMSAVKRQSDSTAFRGGEATAVMGGADIDLRNAVMEGKEARLQVSSVMGGVKIRIPETWTVVSKVDTVMAGYENRTRQPSVDNHRLILEGTVLMGGLKVTN
jgi:hypothetical protein